ncbi:MAG: type VII toxin-antitoxin system MntA family adenylyltransferase antitoxin [Actinomycetota bacterium]
MDEATFERLRDAAALAFADGAVLFAYLFGSAATGRTHPRSDVDVAVFLDPEAGELDTLRVSLDLAGRLESASGVGNVEVVVLNAAPLALQGRAVRERRVLYSRDESTRVAYESLTLREFFDFDIHARRLDRELLRRHSEGAR